MPTALSKLAFVSSLAALLLPSAALAQVTQPDAAMTILPQPTPQAEIDVVTSRGFPTDAVTLEGLFSYRGEVIDIAADASTTPGAFSPLCGFTGELVLRGGGCKVAFGWYNATGSGVPPADSEIYELVPQDPSVYMQCQDPDFCPLATMQTTQDGQHTWVPRTFSADMIRTDARYAGGLVGFALIGNPSSDCSQTKFSQRELNVVCTNCTPNTPWVATLIWQSVVTPDAYYVGFEDLPMSPTDWRSGSANYSNDGDFNDFVYFVTGLSCEGGGQPCDTGQQGACAQGRTNCTRDGTIVCNPVVQPQAETCDNIDNDCDGVVDQGDLCDANQVCDRGSCVSACGSGEFDCESGLACDDGFCKDPLCVNVDCPPGQACRGGTCVGGCDGVICPGSQECQLGRCVDLCANVVCESDQVCSRGVCVANCNCRDCPDGEQCDSASGQCVQQACVGVACGVGQHCVDGACVDVCQGAICPGNAECVAGVCGVPLSGSAGEVQPGNTGPTIMVDDSAAQNPAQGTGTPMTEGQDTPSRDLDASETESAGCACRATGVAQTGDFGPSRSLLGLFAGVMAWGAWASRRRRAA